MSGKVISFQAFKEKQLQEQQTNSEAYQELEELMRNLFGDLMEVSLEEIEPSVAVDQIPSNS